MGMLSSRIMPLSGRKWIGKVIMKWKKRWGGVLYEKPGSIPTHVCPDGCQMSDMSYDNTICIRQLIRPLLLLYSVKYILVGPLPNWSTHNCLTLYLYLKHQQIDIFKIIQWFLFMMKFASLAMVVKAFPIWPFATFPSSLNSFCSPPHVGYHTHTHPQLTTNNQ